MVGTVLFAVHVGYISWTAAGQPANRIHSKTLTKRKTYTKYRLPYWFLLFYICLDVVFFVVFFWFLSCFFISFSCSLPALNHFALMSKCVRDCFFFGNLSKLLAVLCTISTTFSNWILNWNNTWLWKDGSIYSYRVCECVSKLLFIWPWNKRPKCQ